MIYDILPPHTLTIAYRAMSGIRPQMATSEDTKLAQTAVRLTRRGVEWDGAWNRKGRTELGHTGQSDTIAILKGINKAKRPTRQSL